MQEALRSTFQEITDEFAASAAFQDLVAGKLSSDQLRDFLRNLFLPHFQSAHILAFGYALLASEGSELIKENMLEEMGEAGEEAHPNLLLRLLSGAGFSESEIEGLVQASRDQAREFCARQVPFATLRDVGLAVLLESAAFEHFLSRHSGAIGEALQAHYRLPPSALEWFRLHGELDIRHAEESLTVLHDYAAFHQLGDAQVDRIRQAALTPNPLAKRYFPVPSTPVSWPRSAGIRSITIYRLHIPFREAFRHAQIERSASDSLVVRVEDRDGNVGFGEALPRDYVTGEDETSVVAFIQGTVAAWVLGATFASPEDVLRAIEERGNALPTNSASSTNNAAFCAIDLALLDWAFGRDGASVARWLKPNRQQVLYSGVVSAEDAAAAAALGRRFTEAGIGAIKVKVGVDDDVARVRAVREAIGAGASLRVDANGAWDVEEAVAAITALVPFGIESVEQPVSHRVKDAPRAFREVLERTRVALVADESAITLDDVEALAQAGGCDAVNVRISKNGGLVGAHRIAQAAHALGLKVQVGALVGETAILSAAGRHLAAGLPEVAHAEGSFGTLLLSEDVSEQEVRFGLGGAAPLLDRPGLGITVKPDVLERLAVETIEITG